MSEKPGSGTIFPTFKEGGTFFGRRGAGERKYAFNGASHMEAG